MSAHAPIVVARPLPAPDDGLVRVGWLRTIGRLALEPRVHPWTAHWRLRRRAPLAAVVVALLFLLLFAASGCSSIPLQSVRSSVISPHPAQGLRCESVLISQEVQVPPEGELGDLRVTIDDIPPALGKLRILVRKPRFAAMNSTRPLPDPRSIKVKLSRPRGSAANHQPARRGEVPT